MATNPTASWLTNAAPAAGAMVKGGGGIGAPATKAPNPWLAATQKQQPVGGWGNMGTVPGAIAVLNPRPAAPGPPASPLPPPGIAQNLQAAMTPAGPTPSNLAAAVRSFRPDAADQTYSDPYEAAKQARLRGGPPPPGPAAAPITPPGPAAPAPAGPVPTTPQARIALPSRAQPTRALPPPPPMPPVKMQGPPPAIAQNMAAAARPDMGGIAARMRGIQRGGY